MTTILTSFLALCVATMIFQYLCYLQYAKEKKQVTKTVKGHLVTSN